MSRLFISAAHKSSGKTTLTLGLCAALRETGTVVQPFKKGPDYIDPMWLGRAAGRSCYNLDFYTMAHEEIVALAADKTRGANVAIIEGNKGLYDGLDLDGSNSNAALARLLETPVVLVLDARGMTRGIAPLILGYQAFDPAIRIAGVILNQLGGSRHESKLRAVIEHYTDVPVIGALAHNPRLEIAERHLGLIPSNEERNADTYIDDIRRRVGEQIDWTLLRDIAAQAPPLTPVARTEATDADRRADVRIGVARDAAFGFYYPDDLEAFEHQGAELVFIDTLKDARLPAIDGLFIGGGFPESHMQALEANRSLREDIRRAIETGLPAYAECGGLMYLSRSLSWRGATHAMVGLIPADNRMHERPQGRGYVRLAPTDAFPWPPAEGRAAEFGAHEFHYSSLENLASSAPFAFDVRRGAGIDGRHDGFIHKNLLACYVHQRNTRQNPWVAQFLAFVRARRSAAAPSRTPA